MTRLALIRHGRTAWNDEVRMQGQTDIPLSDAGYLQIRDHIGVALNPELAGFYWMSSPLKRARTTAGLLCGFAPPLEPALMEMNWGDWEGRTLADLRAELGPALQENEDKGLDFRPAGGESPRDVQQRLKSWMSDIAGTRPGITAVCHKGVIRAVMALAYNWDMMGKAPVKLDWTSAHIFELDRDGSPRPWKMNVPVGEPLTNLS
ncbi:MAG: histidine phosphatase family protein [Alphaproteobacteria bacterium]|jgi:broad specificity phosphatase PhoE|nr:histidine phosphatase family protein [Alphaproteobacteria bacterium]MBT4085026.1 histidine phosphatase family protein [Alphaproteobacteria bacterium]MBT4545574.1 histidine phosphatase family protein [Alphaproteobacteria bacterium]MBT7745421.1 histidine phosphatase family protein [Alphaproteobacteria bacterium]